MANSDPLSLTAMLNALPKLRIPTASEAMREEYMETPSPEFSPPTLLNQSCSCGFCDASDPREVEEMRLQWMFLMTNSQQDVGFLFEEIFSSLNLIERKRIALFLTSDSDYFMEIATNQYGSERLQKLMGFDDVDTFFCEAILYHFLHVMTDEHASKVAVRAMRIWDGEKKQAMFEYTLFNALDMAYDQHGCITLSEIITNLDNSYHRDQLVDIVARNALWLSADVYGNFVVQHLLKLNALLGRQHIAVHDIAVRFCGHCVELSFQKHGNEVVKRLLEVKESVVPVVLELMQCEGDRLVKLARSEYGHSVVSKALRVTHEMRMLDLFWGLVRKLRSSDLQSSPRSHIEVILDSV